VATSADPAWFQYPNRDVRKGQADIEAGPHDVGFSNRAVEVKRFQPSTIAGVGVREIDDLSLAPFALRLRSVISWKHTASLGATGGFTPSIKAV
jgi:hypothetical protein